jgi:hypothetical protein
VSILSMMYLETPSDFENSDFIEIHAHPPPTFRRYPSANLHPEKLRPTFSNLQQHKFTALVPSAINCELHT